MRDILVKILDAIIALQPADDTEPAETPEEPEEPVVEPAENNVSDTRATVQEEPEEVPVEKTTKRSVKK